MKFGQGTQLSSLAFPSLQYPPVRSMEKPKPLIYVGAPVFGEKSWKGSLYPEGTKNQELLKEYGKIFRTLEMNSTFYGVPNEEKIDLWRNEVPKDFKFCPKVPRSVTHEWGKIPFFEIKRRLEFFLKQMERFSSKLGTIFFQFPETFSSAHFPDLLEVIETLSLKNLSFEFRNQEVLHFALKAKLSLVSLDTPNRPELFVLAHDQDKLFVRFLSVDAGVDKDQKRMEAWKKYLLEKCNAQRVDFMIHHPDESLIPLVVKKMKEVFNEVEIHFTPAEGAVKKQLTLF